MECVKLPLYEKVCYETLVRDVSSRELERKLGATGSCGLRLDFAHTTIRVVSGSTPPAARAQTSPRSALPSDQNFPFMNEMDEISYWVNTKRAPCLLSYDKLKRQKEEAQCSTSKLVDPVVNSPKKKRKLSILNDTSSTEKQLNIYFETSQQLPKTVLSSCKSASLGSDLDFNIKKSSIQQKSKRLKLQKNSKTTLHRKNKVLTSTPKLGSLRRSARRIAKLDCNNTQSNNTLHIITDAIVKVNGKHVNTCMKLNPEKLRKSDILLADGDKCVPSNKSHIVPKNNPITNGQFEDLSDVSGFTANYIRSTKLQATKTNSKLKNKSTRNLVNRSRENANKKGKSTVVCIDKSMNTGLPQNNVLNCSTDSSQNIINLVTKDSNSRSMKLNKSTSILKFMNTSKEQNVTTDLNSSNSRYLTRHRSRNLANSPDKSNLSSVQTPNKNQQKVRSSERKENATKADGKKSAAVQKDSTILVLNNSTEQTSSAASINVASPTKRSSVRKKRPCRNLFNMKKSADKSRQSLKESMKDKSGYAACFTDSDDDKPLKAQKFFC